MIGKRLVKKHENNEERPAVMSCNRRLEVHISYETVGGTWQPIAVLGR